MIVERWAESFAGRPPVGVVPRRSIALHLADAGTAFLAGAASAEGRAIAKLLRGTGGIDSTAAAIAAMLRRTECDDIHTGACITPASVVMPCALAATMARGGTVDGLERAVTAGYEVGLRLGRAVGGAGALAAGIWPTYLAAPMMAAATVAVALGLEARAIADAIALAAAGAGGRLGRPAGTPSARWLLFGEAVAKGCRAALAAEAGFRGDLALISAEWLAALAPGAPLRAAALSEPCEDDIVGAVGLKPFVAARQIVNALVAFQAILAEGVVPAAIERVEVGLPTANAAMSARPPAPGDRLDGIANIHLQIAAAALEPALLFDVERASSPGSALAAFASRVAVRADTDLDAAFPERWTARVRVIAGGRAYERLCERIPGDPGEGGAERVIAAKIDRMVPPADQPICRDLLAAGVRFAPGLKALWDRMAATIA